VLALIAGKGALPDDVAARLQTPPVICAMSPFFPDSLPVDISFRLEQFGSFLVELKSRGVTEVCLAGAVGRPPIDPGQIDAATLPLVPVLQAALQSGDDSALRTVMGLFQDAGFTVLAAHDVAPELLMGEGCPTRKQPEQADIADATRGAAIVAAMAVADIGQACVVQAGQALAIESVFGTDWMLASLKHRPDGAGGLLFKVPKPGQDRRSDLPTIGPDTVAAAAAVGLAGIVIEAGGVMVLNQDAVLEACDRLGLFLWLRGPQG
jgi:UDP-2,3-diacylglucosamine hydrolase